MIQIIFLIGFMLFVVIGVAWWASSGQTLNRRGYNPNDPNYVDPGPLPFGYSAVDAVTGIATVAAIDSVVGDPNFDQGNVDPTDISDAPSGDFGSFDGGSFDGGSFDAGSFDGASSDGGGGGGGD